MDILLLFLAIVSGLALGGVIAILIVFRSISIELDQTRNRLLMCELRADNYEKQINRLERMIPQTLWNEWLANIAEQDKSGAFDHERN